ncbi:von Willebrand factor type A [Paenibacillus curdlanolyticus YK9]|uniref:von Willebrand factor type A n=1 Tax=Paenibacillus curdlanolyticus YK9 TaxID=717606 RepID=E0IEC2_9BACL|nr:IPT/TIG domain-containing protein [Paenibacillus curdlanolyticus]EFM09010.1 von Willebrand factor type A [Paenibacillus curdlanolyticus YK9]
MRTLKRYFALIVTMSLVLGLMVQAPLVNAAVNDYVSVTKTVNPTTITTEDEAEVTLNVTGIPPANVVVPNDVVLIIDKSGSMAPSYNNGEDKMLNAKEAAKGFVDLMDLTKHRVAIVDFSSSNMIGNLPFTTNPTEAKNYIDTINANGSTATGDAIDSAIALLANHRPEAQPVIVIMTDGDATQPSTDPYGYAKQKALLAKDNGIIFYTIALLKSTDDPVTSGPNILLKEMATTSDHHHFVLGSTGLSQIYAAIVKEIGMASAYDVTVTDNVDPNFEIVPGSYDNNIPKPTVTGNTLVWDFNELKNSTLSFKYKIRPVDKTKSGTFPVSTATSKITYKDYAGGARYKLIPSVNLTVKLPAPQITSIIQPFGHPDGGETVTINGKNFFNGATVTFGTVAATNVSVVNSTTITATVPAGKQGTVDVTVKNPDTQKAIGQYQYKTDPIVTSITPANGALDGGNTVIIQGNYMMKGLTVKFGDNTAAVTMYSNQTYIKVTAPKGAAAGPVDVTILNPDETSKIVDDGYTYNEPPKTDPEVLSITPNTGVVTGGDIAYVDGKNFKNGLQVLVGGKSAATTYVSTTRLKVTIPAGDQAGAVDVSVVDAEGKTYTLAGAYTYTAIVYPIPTITAVTPNTGLLAGGNIVYVDGGNFTNITKVSIGGKDAPTTYVSATRVKATVPAGDNVGKVNVKVTTGTAEAELAAAYEYTVPVIDQITITSLTPNTGLLAGGTIVYIDGVNFKSGAKVAFGSNIVSSSYVSSTRIKVTTPAAVTPGKVDVTVTNTDGGTGSLAQGFEYTAALPTITGMTPNHASKAGGDIIYVDGTNFDNTATVTINGNSAAVTLVNATRLKVTVPANATIGDVPLVVTLSNGLSVTATFTYDNGLVAPAPILTSMTATSGTAAGGNIIYIDGKNFVNKPKVYFGSTQVVTVTFVSATRVKVTVPAGVSGPVDVKVVNPDGQESNTLTYTYN